MPDSIQKMNHYYIVDDNHGGMYRIGAQGDVDVIQRLLERASRNVRYVGDKPEPEKKSGRGRNFMGIKFISCRYQYQLGVKNFGQA